MRIGTIVFSKPAIEAVRLGVLSEKLGFNSFWVNDHLMDLSGTMIDPWTTISAISVQTRKIILGSSVTDTQRSHPAKTAQVVATLNEISGGRVVLGIGAGEAMNLVPFGISFDRPEVRIQRLAEAVQVIRALWSSSQERPVSFRGKFYQLRNAWLDQKVGRAPRIYVGVFGARKGLEVVGNYADGWLPWVNTPETFRERCSMIRKAARKAGRDERTLDFVAPIYTTLTRDRRRLRRVLNVVKQVLVIERNTLRKLGFSPPAQLGATYQTILVRKSVNETLAKLQDSIPDEVAERFLAHGSPSQILERIDEFREAGATHLVVQFLENMEPQMGAFSKKILPMIRAQRNL